jgi:hypothetical protein
MLNKGHNGRITIMSRYPLFAFFVAISIALGQTRCSADKALVIGVNNYTNLPHRAWLTECVRDATDVARTLHDRYGFETTTLIDQDATRTHILKTLANIANTCQPNERFILYFSGHGDHIGAEGVILPWDTLPNSYDNHLTASEINRSVNGIHARSRTVILDSCFSGAMVKAMMLNAPAGGRVKHYAVMGEQSWLSANGQDLNPHFTKDAGEVCYFAASRSTEVARESMLGPNSVFTSHLLQKLNGQQDLWSSLQTAVAELVAQETDNRQHPTLSPRFASTLVFENAGDHPVPPPADLLELFNRDNVEPEMVSLSISPNMPKVAVGTKAAFSVRCGVDGYLLLIEHGTSGKIKLMYPAGGALDRARIQQGQTIKTSQFTADAQGVDRVKAFLFTDREEAQAVINALRSISLGNYSDLNDHGGQKDWQPDELNQRFFTSFVETVIE